jgi:hypothetical protein
MARIAIDEFMKFVKSLEGQDLLTLYRRRKFRVRVLNNGLEFIPLSTGKLRTHSEDYVARVLKHFNKTRSFSPSAYKSLTANASYQLALIHRYLIGG